MRALFRESKSDFAAADAGHEENGWTDVYDLTQSIAAEDGRDPPYAYSVLISRFEAAPAAAAFVDERPAAFAERPRAGFSDVELIEDAQEIGDQSALLSFDVTRRDGTAAGAYEYYLRVGDTVAIVQLNGVPDVPLAVLKDLAEGQAACLGAGACDWAAVPAALSGAAGRAAAAPPGDLFRVPVYPLRQRG